MILYTEQIVLSSDSEKMLQFKTHGCIINPRIYKAVLDFGAPVW